MNDLGSATRHLVISNHNLEISTLSSLNRRGIALVQEIELEPSWRMRNIHEALVGAAFLGGKDYFAKHRERLPDLDLDEHFLFTFTAFASGLPPTEHKGYKTNLQNYGLIDLEENRALNPEILGVLSRLDSLPDTLVDTYVTNWDLIDNSSKNRIIATWQNANFN